MGNADYKSLKEFYSEWEDGIVMGLTGERIAPLKVLEKLLKTGKTKWRNGDNMRGNIADRLAIIYALLRRLPHIESGDIHILLGDLQAYCTASMCRWCCISVLQQHNSWCVLSRQC